jgi:hypothetical protein
MICQNWILRKERFTSRNRSLLRRSRRRRKR